MSALFNFAAWLKSRAAMTVLIGATLAGPALAQRTAPSSSPSRMPQATLRLPTAPLGGQLSANPNSSTPGGNSSSAGSGNQQPGGHRRPPRRPHTPDSSKPHHDSTRPQFPKLPQPGTSSNTPSVIVTPVPNQPQPHPQIDPIPPRLPQPNGPVVNPRPNGNPVVTTNPLPLPNPTSPTNPLPPTRVDEPQNKAPLKKFARADRALAKRVQGEVSRLRDLKVHEFLNLAADSPLNAEQLSETGYDRKLDTYTRLLKDDAADEELGRAAQALMDGRDALADAELEGVDGLGKWLDDLEAAVKDATLVAGVEDAIADALADAGDGLGMDPGLFGPGWLAPGGGGAEGPVIPGPDGFAPGGDGPDDPGPGFGGPDDFEAPMGDGGGGGGGGGGGIDIDIDLWFGFGGCPVCCCPWLPADCCWWIGPHVIVCGTGGFGGFGVMYCPPAYIGLPVPYVLPVANALPYVDYAGRIVLLNPLETGAMVSYVVSNQAFSMDAGMMQDIELATTVIRFDRGGGFGEAVYTLTPASYKFVITDHGWDLVKTSFQATFDNTANAGDFSLVLDGAVVTIAAGSKQILKSAYPIVVSFDNGMGDTVSKQLANGATYTIGVNVATSGWDLFPGDAAATGVVSPPEAYTVASAGPIAPPVPAPMP